MKKYLPYLAVALVIIAGIIVLNITPNRNNKPMITNMEVVDRIASAAVKPNPYTGENSVPVNPVKITSIDMTGEYTALLHTTEGDITINLNTDQTPKTVKNFTDLAKKGFYNNTIFHRVIKGFMIQGGDPEGTGMGGPGYKFEDEPFTGEYIRGTVAMANSGPNTNGSQFFIMHADYPLPHNYVIFGQVLTKNN